MSRHQEQSTKTREGAAGCQDIMSINLQLQYLKKAVATRELKSRHEERLGPGYFLSTAGNIGIRAQKRKPINRKLPRLKTQVAGASEEIWVA